MTQFVTRVIKRTAVELRYVDLNASQICNTRILLDKRYKETDKNKVLRKTIRYFEDQPNIKVLEITAFYPVDDFVGVPLDWFMDHSVPFDKKTRKPLVETI